MAIRLIDAYPNRTGAANSDYPHGSIVNESAPDAGDGTPLERQWGNDLAGFMQALVKTADITPSGSPDTAPDSQHMDALLDVTRGLTEVDVAGDTDVTLATYDRRMAMVRLTGALTDDIDVVVPDTARHYVFIDATSGGFTVTVKTSGGTGIALSDKAQFVYSDEANVQRLVLPHIDEDDMASDSDVSVPTQQSVKAYVDAQDASFEQQRAQAWVNFAGNATVTVRDSFNVSSITDNGTGDYTVNFINDLANDNYSVSGSARRSNTPSDGALVVGIYNDEASLDLGSVRVVTERSTDAARIDGEEIGIQIFGGN